MAEEKQKSESLLERTLSLSKNGGIYYGGARVEHDARSAVLFVGLGGSGADALIRIKDQIKTRMILPSDKTGAPIADSPENIGFLAIDTDNSVSELAYGIATFDSFGNEFCDISVSSVPKVIEDILKEKEKGVECWQWFDNGINNVNGKKGAGGVRQIGRMLLFNNIDKVTKTVEGKIKTLVRDNPNINELLLYVFSGISGGTGAGTFLDMAYILQKIAKAQIPNASVMGYLIMPDVNEQHGGNVDSLRANAFAGLKELDYWMSAGEHGERYIQKFPKGFELNEFSAPFDFCHLLDASDAEGHQFSYDKILRSVAENTFAYVAGEAGGGEGGASTMASMYSNISKYILTLASNAKYPACHNYLSLGAAKIEIPYTEISTLIAARVFERLEKGMFKNRAPEDVFQSIVGRTLEMHESNIRGALYKNVNGAGRPLLTIENYKYEDVWPNNAPYFAADQWLAGFQRAVIAVSGGLPNYLEGNLKTFIKNNLRDKSTGPIYLAHFIKSNANYNLFKILTETRKYCKELQSQCVQQAHRLQEEMGAAYNAGVNVKSKKKQRTEFYLQAVETWYRNEEYAFLNGKIVEVLDVLIARVNLYYEKVLRPLADILLELPGIFEKNVEYIKVNRSEEDISTDILIKPLEFERTRKNEFDAAVIQAENNFLNSLSGNIRKWIGRDVDEVDENIVGNVDVAGFISNFISQNFSALLTINMESIMTTKLSEGENLSEYVKKRVDDLLANSYPMFKEEAGLSGEVEQFAIISVPNDCPTILKATKEHIEKKGLSKIVGVKKSEEKSRFYIIKIASGYPLYSNAFIEGMETAYEKMMSGAETSVGVHLHYNWIKELPSPYIELAWKGAYECKRTKERNQKYKGFFDRCMKNGVIRERDEKLYIQLANPEIVPQVSKKSLTAPTLLGKTEQFEKIKQALHQEGREIVLPQRSIYMRGREDINWRAENVKENILRFPNLLNYLEKEEELARKIEEINEELLLPRYYSYARICHMIFTESITGDTVFRENATDPFPVGLTQGAKMHPDYIDYQIYASFCEKLTPKMKNQIDQQYENMKNRITINEKALKEYTQDLNDSIREFDAERSKAQEEMSYSSMADRQSYLEKIEFYDASVEEMKRMLPHSRRPQAQPQGSDPLTAQTAAPHNTTPQQPPRYLNPQTWQPITDPQPGQQVFDTKQGKVVAYQPEAPRYLNPQTWQPIANPQPGQQVFDTKAGQVVIYQPEPPRYLNTQTWQPIADPQPGQPVFDTKVGQVVVYQPETAFAGGYPGASQGGYPGAGQGQPGYPGASQVPGGYPGAGQVPGGYPGAGQGQGGYPGAGQAQPGYPGASQAQPGYPGAGQVPGGYPGAGQAQPGYPGAGQVPGGYPGAGQGQPGYPGAGQVPGGYPGAGQAQPGYPGAAPTQQPEQQAPVQDVQPGGYPGGNDAAAQQPAAPRYLDPQTYQPVQNPQPGQPVFDTVTGQVITYYPYQA